MGKSSSRLFTKKISRTLLYFGAGYAFIFSFGLFKLPFLTNYFKPEQLGIYAVINSFLSYIDVVFFSWINGTIGRYVYDRKFQNYSTLLSGIFPFLCLAILLAGATTFFLSFLVIANTNILMIAFLSGLTNQLLSLYFTCLLYKHYISRWCVFVCLQNLLSFLLLITFVVFYKLDIRSIFLSTLVGNSILLVFYLIPRYLRKSGIVFLLGNLNLYKSLFSFSVLLTITNIFLTALNNADRFIIDYYKSKEKLGQYSQNHSLATVGFYSFVQLFSTIFSPLYIKNISSGERPQSNIKIVQLYLLIFFPVLCFLIFNSSSLTDILFGKEFRGFSEIFNWVAAGIFCYGFANFFEIRLKIFNRVGTVAVILGIHACLNIVLNMFLLKWFTINMAAVVTFFCYFSIMLCFIFKNWIFFLQLNLSELVRNLFWSSALFLMVCILIKNSSLNNFAILIINGILGGTIYFLFLQRHYYIIKYSVSEMANHSALTDNNVLIK